MMMKSKNTPLVATINKIASSKKKLLTSAVLLSIGGFASSANADLSNGSLGLDIQGNLSPACLYGGTYPSCDYGAFDTADAGSFFSMDGSPAGAIDGDVLMLLNGAAQAYNGNPVPPTYDDSGTHVTAPWDFFGARGTNVHSGLGVSVGDTVVDMGTWGVVWGEVPFIDMGGDAGQGDTGTAALVCTGGADASCELNDTFTLDYSAHVPIGDPSGFGGVLYELHLQGVVSAVPVPAAVWLFGSGLLGLVGIARRRKAA